MEETWTLAKAFAYFGGAEATNKVWGWSAISPDKRIVVLTLWEDQITYEGGRLVYDMRDHPKREVWQTKLGNRDRLKNLRHAYGNPEVEVRAVRLQAKDSKAHRRSILTRKPDKTLLLKITDLNIDTGEFRVEEILQ